jgi:cell division protein FtsB
MDARLVAALLIGLLAVVQGQLWLGRGSVVEVAQMEHRLQDQRDKNAAALQANAQLQAEVRDLQEGLEIVEEKARSELGMVKPDEILIQIVH